MPEIRFISVYDLLKLFGADFVDAIGKSLDRKKDATHKLRESIRFTTKIFSEHYTFELKMEDYYEWVDKGRKPGKFPPYNSILRWINDKKLRPREGQKDIFKRKGLKVLSVDVQAAKTLAYLIGRKIKRFGIKPTNFYSKVENDGRLDKLRKNLSMALKKDVLVQIQEIKKDIK